MKIQGNVTFQYIFNLHNKKNKSIEEQEEVHKARKEDPELDRMLYLDDLNKVYEEQAKVEAIARKVARGEKLTEEEKELINRVNPEMLRKAEAAKQENESLKQKLRNAKSKQEALGILSQACMGAQQITECDPQYGNLLMELIQEAHADYNKDTGIPEQTRQYEKNQQYKNKLDILIDSQC
ncbi:hypothetical protein [Clostridium sporogenes]|uniref:hypothetical protein n=1 Tax=Clostridium sporogenes TaxID=1509 RepID=UPI0005EF3DEB|nr:hypothetical protein [Clostridium sporogenes]